MSSDTNKRDPEGINRRSLVAGAAGTAAALHLATASAQSNAQEGQLPSNSTSGKRVAIVTDARLHMGPHLARTFARMNYNLVIADPAEGVPDELRGLGADVVVVPGIEQEGPNNEGKPGSMQKLVDAAMDKFGGFDSAFIRTAIHLRGDILEETADGMQKSYEQNCLAVFYALQAVLPPLLDAGRGQVVVLTSATGQKPYPQAVARGWLLHHACGGEYDGALRRTNSSPEGSLCERRRHEFPQLSGFPRVDGRHGPKGAGNPSQTVSSGTLRRNGRVRTFHDVAARRSQHVHHREFLSDRRRLQQHLGNGGQRLDFLRAAARAAGRRSERLPQQARSRPSGSRN